MKFCFSRSCFSLATSTYTLRAGWDGGGGGAPIKSHKRAALLHNRNRLPVIVKQNGNDRLEGRKEICGRGARRTPCHSALLRNYRVYTYGET